MDTVQKLVEARQSINVPYIKLQQQYKPEGNQIYGFVEGADDLTYYRHHINPLLPADFQHIKLSQVGTVASKGGKAKVIGLYNQIDWSKYDKKRVWFFIDKDLSDFTHLDICIDDNVYTTDDYSIENDVVTNYTLDALVCDYLKLIYIKPDKENYIAEIFNKEKESFCRIMADVMANIIFWKISKISNTQYNNLNLCDFFNFTNCEISLIINGPDFTKRLYRQCRVNYSLHYNNIEVEKIKANLLESGLYLRFIRGKYILWFLENFIKSLASDVVNMGILEDGAKYKKHPINSSTFLNDSAVRSMTPTSLKRFVNEILS